MASLIKRGELLNMSDTAPAPCKDFVQIMVTQKEVVYRWWKITPRSDHEKLNPKEIKDSHDDFICDDRLQSEIQRTLGKSMVDYIKLLVTGNIDYLPRVSDDLLIKIILFLDLEDIARLAQVNKKFRKLCKSDELWEKIYKANSELPVTSDLEDLAKEQGWQKLFFTNKLQLQMQLRRKAKQRDSVSSQQKL